MRHLGEELRFLFSQIVELGAVGLDVVELPSAPGSFCDEFPFALADGAVALVFEEEGAVLETFVELVDEVVELARKSIQ